MLSNPMNWLCTRVAASFVLLLCFNAVAAQATVSSIKGNTQPQKNETVVQPNRPVVPEVTGDPTNRTGGPIYITVTLKNVSTKTQSIDGLAVYLESGANARFKSVHECRLAVTRQGGVTLQPNETFSQRCRFPQPETGAARTKEPKDLGWENQAWWQNLFDVDLIPEVVITTADDQTTFFLKPISVKSPEWAIFVGGIVGALLLAFFVAAERILKNPADREKWGQTMWVTTVMGLRGGLMAIFALLLGSTTQSGGSPVSLSVEDFTGGVLIGLFSYPLASWISSTLKLDGVFVSRSSVKQNDTSQGSSTGSLLTEDWEDDKTVRIKVSTEEKKIG